MSSRKVYMGDFRQSKDGAKTGEDDDDYQYFSVNKAADIVFDPRSLSQLDHGNDFDIIRRNMLSSKPVKQVVVITDPKVGESPSNRSLSSSRI